MSSFRRHTLLLVVFVFAVLMMGSCLHAQTPIALPNTMGLVAGGGAATTATHACATGSPYTAVDAFGDGCPGALASFSADVRGGIGVDPQGNIYVSDTTNNWIRVINGRSGIVNLFAGAGTACGGKNDITGDNCPVANTASFNGPRGMNVDPYGNVLIADYGRNFVQIVCMAVSPLCPNTTGTKLVGSMYRIAGCTATTTSTSGTASVGTTAGSAGDGLAATPFNNLAADVSAWGSGSGATSTTGTCSNSLGGVDQARGVAADKYGNVYIGDTANLRYRVVPGPASYNGVTNPLAAVLALSTATYNSVAMSSVTGASAYGKIYPILGGFTAPTSGAFCNGSSGAKALDAVGDGCPYYQNSIPSTSTSGVQGVAVDSNGNVIFADAGDGDLRVLYMGGSAMANAITVNNATVTTPVVGSVYLLAGINATSGGTGPATTTAKGTATTLDSSIFKVAVDPVSGNIVVGDSSQILYFDVATGYIRKLFSSSSSRCTTQVDALNIGDGCPASQATFTGSNGLGVAFDSFGNLYLADTETASYVRKVSAASLVAPPVNTSITQNVVLHGGANTTSIAASLLSASPDISAGTVTCGSANTDTTMECTVPITYKPLSPNTRAATLTATASGSTGSGVYALAGGSIGSALVTDSSATTTASFGSGIAAASVALDGSSNIYTMDATAAKFTKITSGGTATQLPGTLPTTPKQLAVDGYGNVYAVGTGSASYTKLTLGTAGTYTASTVTLTGAAPAGIAVDVAGNIFISDTTTETVYEIAANSTNEPNFTVVSGLTGAGPLAIDGQGNLYVSDTGASKVYKVSGATIFSGVVPTKTTAVSSVNAVGLAADAAGDLYIQDGTAKTVTEIPVSGPTTTVLSSLTTPTGIAVDGNGVIYSADAAATSITQVQRNAVTYALGTSNATTQLGTVTDVGNLAATGIVQTGSNTNAFALSGGSSNGCAAAGIAVTTTTAVGIGTACTLQATLATSGSGAVTDAATFNEATATQTAGSLTVTGTLTGTATGTTTTISGETPASPLYVASGTTVSFTVTVAPASGTTAPTGTISYTLDSNSPVTGVALTTSGSNGVGTITLSGITAGTHTLVATYPATGSFATSVSTPTTSFSVGKASTSVSWTPGATTQTVSSAIGAGVLDATSGGSLPGAFSYTVTPSGGSATSVDASSYLGLGTYSLGVTFTPTDSTDYNTSTGSVGTYTVTQASTTAPVGASQFLVASDGTGNYSTIQSAVNAVGISGGSIYIKPGTYNGMISVVQPNVSLRGLGGVPQNVILTHESGAFSVNPGTVYNYTGEFTVANSNGYQLPSGSSQFSGDEGSATIVVAKGINTALSGSTLLPYNFYAENLSFINTYDSDTSTTTTTYVTGGVCTANAGAAATYSALFNAGTECASQALAIWITGDQAVLNNVYATSLQDTVYAGSGGCGSPCTVSRQYWWKGKITGNVDYIFGDAAAVFDHDNIYTLWHGTATGSETVEAQNKGALSGSGTDYLSGYVFNGSTFTSQSTGMTHLDYGRPYGTYSTMILLNSYVDQVDPAGWVEFSGDTNLPTSTYAEFNTSQYTDPATGNPDLNGVIYLGTGLNTGSGVTGTREVTSQDPGTPMTSNTIKTQMTAAQAAAYYPVAFLGTKVGSGGIGTLSTGSSAIWNAATALATNVNAFVPSATTASVNAGGSITILMRPQTPGGGVLPTGTYTLFDGGTQLVTGTLDASGEAYYTSSSLTTGSHSITWTYGGDSNFTGSTTSTPLIITVTAGPFNTTTTIAVSNASTTYGTVVTGTITVAPASGSGAPTGSVNYTLDSGAPVSCTLVSGVCSLSLSGLSAGSHTLTASYAGDANNNSSSTTGSTSLTVAKGALTVAAVSTSRTFGQANPTLTYTMTGFAYSDNQSTATTGAPSITTTAVRISPVGSYPIAAAAGTLAASNYTISYTAGTLTVSSGAAQTIKFMKLPNFPGGRSYQLAARASSGLAVTYTITAGSSNASISGSTLTVNSGSTGVGVTVQAAQAGNGTYAAATSVSQSFTAQ